MPNKTFDTIAGCVFLIIGAFFIVASSGISASSYGSKVGPNIFPTGLGAILVALSVIVIAQARGYAPAEKKGEPKNTKRFWLVLSSTFVYILLFETLGYVISTFLYLVFVFQVMERKRLFVSVAIAAFFAAAVYGIYVIVLQGTLPPFPEWLPGMEGG
jgi:putative tricarboxylic transport membrane protein